MWIGLYCSHFVFAKTTQYLLLVLHSSLGVVLAHLCPDLALILVWNWHLSQVLPYIFFYILFSLCNMSPCWSKQGCECIFYWLLQYAMTLRTGRNKVRWKSKQKCLQRWSVTRFWGLNWSVWHYHKTGFKSVADRLNVSWTDIQSWQIYSTTAKEMIF